MTLNELMANSDHEVYFCVVTPDKEEHIFLSSDYHGAHPDVMPELGPLLDMEVCDYDLVIRDDPEKPDVFNADKVPMIWVPVTGERKAFSDMSEEEFLNFASRSDAVKNLGNSEFSDLIDGIPHSGSSGLSRCLAIVKSISESMKSLKLRSKLLLERSQSDSGEEGSVARVLRAKLEKASETLRERAFAAHGAYMEAQKNAIYEISRSASEFDTALDGRRGREASAVESMAYQLGSSISGVSSFDGSISGTVTEQLTVLKSIERDVSDAAKRNISELPEDVKSRISELETEIEKCLSAQKEKAKTCSENIMDLLGKEKRRRDAAIMEAEGISDVSMLKDAIAKIRKSQARCEELHERLLNSSVDKAERKVLTATVSLCREKLKPLKDALARIEAADASNHDIEYIDAVKWAERELGQSVSEKDSNNLLMALVERVESGIRDMPSASDEQVKWLSRFIKARAEVSPSIIPLSEMVKSLEGVIERLDKKRRKMRADMKKMPSCTASSKAKLEAMDVRAKEISKCVASLGRFLESLKREAAIQDERQIKLLKSLAGVLRDDGKRILEADSALKWIKTNQRIFN